MADLNLEAASLPEVLDDAWEEQEFDMVF